MGQASWLQTQRTHLEGVTGLADAFPVHFEACRAGHMSGEQVCARGLDLQGWQERMRCVRRRSPRAQSGTLCRPASHPQFDDAFIEAYVAALADDLPVPECALTLSFIELMGGKLKETPSPVGLKEGGERPLFSILSQTGTAWLLG